MAAMKISQFLRPLTPLVQLCPKFFHPLDLGRPIVQFQTNPPPPASPLPSPNYNQSIKRKHNLRMTMHVIRSFLQVGFCSQYQFINLVWLSIDFYPFSKYQKILAQKYSSLPIYFKGPDFVVKSWCK